MKNFFIKATFLATLAMAVICFFNGCEIKEAKDVTVTVAYNPSGYGSAVSHLMIEDGIFEKSLPEAVKVQWVEMSSASDIRDALASGTVDIAAPALSAYISAKENNMPITLLSNYGNAMVRLYSSDGSKDIADFDENDVLAIKGLNTNPQISFLAYVKENGLDVNKYSNMLSKIPEAETIAMLKDNSTEISGAVLSYPTSKEADDIKGIELVADFKDVINDYNLGNCLCANSEFYKNHHEIVEVFEKSRDEIMDNWSNNLEHNATVLSELYNCDKDEILGIMKELPPTKKVTGYNKLSDLMYECGMLSSPAAPFETLENYEQIPH